MACGSSGLSSAITSAGGVFAHGAFEKIRVHRAQN
jgi:hypothetical protein